jgi:hypothetical protein
VAAAGVRPYHVKAEVAKGAGEAGVGIAGANILAPGGEGIGLYRLDLLALRPSIFQYTPKSNVIVCKEGGIHSPGSHSGSQLRLVP